MGPTKSPNKHVPKKNYKVFSNKSRLHNLEVQSENDHNKLRWVGIIQGEEYKLEFYKIDCENEACRFIYGARLLAVI